MHYNKKSLPSMEDYKKIHYLGSPVYQSVTKQIAWTNTYYVETETTEDRFYRTEITVKDNSGNIIPVTAGGRLEKTPFLCKDGSVYFLSDSDNSLQLYHYSDLKTVKITHLPYGVSDYLLSPDEQKILLISWDTPYSTDFSSPVVYESHPFKSDADLGFKVKRNSTLWLYDCNSKEVTCLLDGSSSFVHPIWTPDSKSIVYQKSCNNCLCIFQIKINGTMESKLLVTAGNISSCHDNNSSMQFTPDGKHLIFPANPIESSYDHPGSLYMVPYNEESSLFLSAVDLIHPDYNQTGMGLTVYPSALFYEDNKRQSFLILPDNRCLYLQAHNGTISIYQIEIKEAGSAIPAPLLEGNDCYYSLTYMEENKILAIKSGILSLPDIMLYDIDKGTSSVITNNNRWINQLQLEEIQIHWIGIPGTASHTQGFFLPPFHVKPEQKYPAILYCHGGPTGFYSSSLQLEFQALAASGFAVIYANPRGSTGYGQIHSQDEDAYNGNGASDLEEFVLAMCRLYPYIDPNRIGICGGSYGGYMTAYMACHSKLFKAASCHRPLLNWQMIGYASHSAGCIHSREQFPDFADYMKDCLDLSPTTLGDSIEIPFQIQQSTKDANCIIEQVFQLYTIIRHTHPDLPCQMILYPDSGHGLLARGPLPLAIRHREDNLEWFKKWL